MTTRRATNVTKAGTEDGAGLRARIRIDLAYDGAPFRGFAGQPGDGPPTVQGTLESALERLVGVPVSLTCAGRTDAGVHALAQVVHGDLDGSARRSATFLSDLSESRRRLDQLVGDAITIWQVVQVGEEFDARFAATERQYRYRIVDSETIDPRLRHTHWHVAGRLALREMQHASRQLLGEHDYAAFCRRAPGRHTVRRLDAVAVSRTRDGAVHVRLRGPAFCHKQVRSIVGCLVEVGRHRQPPNWLGEVLASGDRSMIAPVAPAHGLTLERVSYGTRFPAAPPTGLANTLL